MSITDELREWAGGDTLRAGMSLRTARDQAIAIADRIDAEHQKTEDEWKAKDGQTWLRGYAECHAELMEGNEVIAADLEKAGWVRLPKDADGEYIQPSDIPYLTKANDGKRLAFCPSLELRQDGTWRLAGWTPDRYRISKPTVDGILRDFGVDIAHALDADPDATVPENIIAEYAAKLQLREDA